MKPLRSCPRTRAFAFPDLLAILVVLGLITFLSFPAAANTRNSSAALLCIGNLRQLTTAWQLYASDHQERLVHNVHGGDATGGAGANNPTFAPWASGWLSWGTDSDNTNVSFIRNTKWARISPYLSSAQNIHKCPSDRFLSPVQRAKGWKERTRTYAMNLSLGHVNYRGNAGPFDPIYATVLKTSDLRFPSPSETSVLLDEHPDSMNDAALFPPNANAWIDVPASLHNGVGAFSFADGHAELHAWVTPLRSSRVTTSNLYTPRPIPSDPDIHWVSYHSQRINEKSH